MKTKRLLVMLLTVLCSTLAGYAAYDYEQHQQIDGIFYRLVGWDSMDGQGNPVPVREAWVEHDPDVDPWMGSGTIDTYQGDIVIPETVDYNGETFTVSGVEYYAFKNCKGITSIALPKSVNSISSYDDWRELNNLKSVTVADGNAYYTTIDGVLYNKDVTQILCLPTKLVGGVFRIPATITEINNQIGNPQLDELIIPATVTKLGNGVIYSWGGSRIKKLTIEDGDTELTVGTGSANVNFTDENGNSVESYPLFAYCNIEEIYWGRNLKYSNKYSSPFATNGSLSKITFGSKVTTIPKYTFANCYSVNTVDVLGGIVQWCMFDFTGLYSSPFYYDEGKTVLFNGAALSGDVVLPNTVTTIPAHAFRYGCTEVSSLSIPATVTTIADGAFKNLPSLATISLDAGNTNFTLTDNVLYNKEVTKILCFPQLRAGDFTMPSTITKIPEYSFYHCVNLTGVTLSENLAAISNYAFTGCNKLKTITIPAMTETIGVDAFRDCAALKTVTFTDAATSKMKEIKAGAFCNCSKLNDITIPASTTSIERDAFLDCTALTDITIPATTETIGEYAFNGCKSLATVTFANSTNARLKKIASYVFANCEKLTEISIPGSVEEIGYYAFSGCSSINKVTLEDSTNPIRLRYSQRKDPYGSWYENCGAFGASPVKTLYIGRNIELLDRNWDDNGDGGKSYRYSIFGTGNTLEEVTIAAGVTFLDDGLFYDNCYIFYVYFKGNISQWVNISFAGPYATPFANSCVKPILYLDGHPLHSQVDIPDGATKIGAYSFYGQNGVATFNIPSSVTTIEPYAFNAPYVSDVVMKSDEAPTLVASNAFNVNTIVYVPNGKAADYRAESVWSEIEDRIFPVGFLQVQVELTAMENSPALLPALNALEKVDGEYRITALTNLKIKGTMNGYDFLMIRTKMPNLRHLDLSEVTILDNDGGFEYYTGYHTKKNTITPFTFYNLSNLKSVYLPNNITAIEHNAFSDCGITKVMMPEALQTIEYSAFQNSSLMSVAIPGTVKEIGSSAFYSCWNLKEVGFNAGLERIGSNAFESCGNLTSLVLPTTLKYIDYGAFRGCSNLASIDFARGLLAIGESAFESCYRLKELHMPTTLRTIGYNAFRYCSGLNEVHVPSMITQIGDYAFTGCGLKAVYAYTLEPVQINQNTFDYKGVDLYAPDNSFYAYYINTQWSQFQDVKEFEAKYTDWYTPRDKDVKIDVRWPIRNLHENDCAIGTMDPGSGLLFIGDGEQLVKELILNWKHGDNYPSLISNGNLDVEELRFIMNVYPNRWYFFSFPFDVPIKDVDFDGKWVWRYYDGETRAENGQGGWKNVTDGWLRANIGYIFQCNKEGDLEIPIENPFENETTNTDKDVALETHESANAQDANWNLVGNPHLSYYGLEDLGNFNAPVTVWNEENNTYDAVMPGDDDYDFHPFQAFFVQTPANSNVMTFAGDDRATYAQTEKKQERRAAARAARRVNENRLLLNLTLSNGTMTDKTRVIFNDENKMDYEPGCDATKFMSMASVPQIYTLDGRNVKYAINARPNGNQEVRIGFVANADGEYTISNNGLDCYMALKDNHTGIIHMLDDGPYNFYSDAGTFDTRFTLIPGNTATTISGNGIQGYDIEAVDGGISVNGIDNQTVTIYKANGVKAATLKTSGMASLASGTYIVTVGGKSTKILVK